VFIEFSAISKNHFIYRAKKFISASSHGS